MVITIAQLHSTKPELMFSAGSNPAQGLSGIGDGKGSLAMVPAGNKAERLLSVNHITKIIHYHHLHHDQISKMNLSLKRLNGFQ